MTSPGTLANPFAVIPAANGAASAITIDQGTGLTQLISVAFALRNPVTTTVPIANADLTTTAGSAVEWNHTAATQFFNDLAHDQAAAEEPHHRLLRPGHGLAANRALPPRVCRSGCWVQVLIRSVHIGPCAHLHEPSWD